MPESSSTPLGAWILRLNNFAVECNDCPLRPVYAWLRTDAPGVLCTQCLQKRADAVYPDIKTRISMPRRSELRCRY